MGPAAVCHAGHHEQTVGVFDFRRASRLLQNALVVTDAVRRRDLWIAPAIILDQFAAVIDKRLEVGGNLVQ